MTVGGKAEAQQSFGKNPLELVELLRRRAAERSPPRSVQLPLWPDSVRGVPNGILRSALFAAIGRSGRRYLHRERVPSLDGTEVVYTGELLDQSDLDVWEGALHLAREEPLGQRIQFTEKGFLRLIGRGGLFGRSIGRSDREWLRGVLARLKATAVEIRMGRYGYVGSLIDDYFQDFERCCYVLIINPRLVSLFGVEGWSRIDWGVRQALRGFPLAKWLHGFYSSHAYPYPMRVETLHRLCGSQTGGRAETMGAKNKAFQGWRDQSLIPALMQVAQACRGYSQIFEWVIKDGRLVEVSRTPRLQGRALVAGGDRIRKRGDRIRKEGG